MTTPIFTVRCGKCGKDFVRRTPHRCAGGFRKRRCNWIFLEPSHDGITPEAPPLGLLLPGQGG